MQMGQLFRILHFVYKELKTFLLASNSFDKAALNHNSLYYSTCGMGSFN